MRPCTPTAWPLRRHHIPRLVLACVVALLASVTVVLAAGSAAAVVSPGVSELLSVRDDGSQVPPNGSFGGAADAVVSGNGRYVAFDDSTPLDPLASPGTGNVYVRDRQVPGHTVLISRGIPTFVTSGAAGPSGPGGSSEAPANGDSSTPSISATGRYVVFQTTATNIPGGDSTNGFGFGIQDVVICDRDPDGTGTLDRRGPDGSMNYRYTVLGRLDIGESDQRNFSNGFPGISSDGTTVSWAQSPVALASPETVVVAHLTKAANGDLTAPDPSRYVDAHTSFTGHPEADALEPTLSSDGQHVAFLARCPECASSEAPRPGETMALDVEDLVGRRTTRVDVDAKGGPLTGLPGLPSLSGDGRVVAFQEGPANETGPPQVIVVNRDPDRNGQLGPGNGQRITTGVVSGNRTGGTGEGQEPALSTDGRYVAFDTNGIDMSNGVDTRNGNGEGNGTPGPPGSGVTGLNRQVVVRDLVVDAARVAAHQPRLPAELASPSAGTQCGLHQTCAGNGDSVRPSVDADGGVVAYASSANDLVPTDSNGSEDVFARHFQPTLTADGVDFGTVPFGGSGTASVTVREVGFGPVQVTAVAVTGRDGHDFAVFPAENCTGTVLHETETCLVSLRFVPSGGGARSAGLALFRRGGSTPVVVPVVGGVGPALNTFRATPDPLAFPGSRLALSASAPGVVTVTNGGLAPFAIRTVTVLGGPRLFPGDYLIAVNGCAGVILPPGGTCRMSVLDIPHGSGVRPGALRFDDTSGGGPHLVGLTATGTTPTVRVSPGVVTAGRVTTVTGTGWPSGGQVTLALPTQPGNHALTAVVLPDGTFTAPLVMFEHAATGTWTVDGTASGTSLTASTTLLVVLGTYQPPGFTNRR
jgi:hypothetical protein